MIGKNREQTLRVIHKDEKIPALKTKKKNSAGSEFYYSFFTVILLLCLVQITISAVVNISKIVSYKAKIVQITKNKETAMALNDQLKDNIKNFSKLDGMEAIARNNLKMSGEDEVLVIINTSKEEEPVEKPKKFKLFNFRHDKDEQANH